MKLLAFWIGSGIGAYLLIGVPIIFLTTPGPIVSFLLGMALGGLTPPVLLLNSRIADWVGF